MTSVGIFILDIVVDAQLIMLRKVYLDISALFFLFCSVIFAQSSYLCNAVNGALFTYLRARHRFTTLYALLSSGIVESVCKEFFRILHAVSTEFDLPKADWTKAVQAL